MTYWTYQKEHNPYFIYIRALNRLRLWKRSAKKYSDRQAIIKMYSRYSGHNPALENPTTFSEKMQWMKLHYHRDCMTKMADKYEVRTFLMEKGYHNILSKVIKVYENAMDIHPKDLPNRFVMKASHGSGWNLVVKDKSRINWFMWKKIMKVWLGSNYFYLGREKPYLDMKPRIIVEEYMEDESGGLMDFKFFCFHGKAQFVQADRERGSEKHIQSFYDMDWDLMGHARGKKEDTSHTILPPEQFEKMKTIAEDLSQSFPFMRVDFYEVNGEIVFGEMTFYPKSGLPYFRPNALDLKFGKLLNLDQL